MMETVHDVAQCIEAWAPLSLQESYDNSGLLVGDASMPVTGILLAIDVTEQVVHEAIERGCNLIVAHHPVMMGGIRKLTGSNDTQRLIIKAIRHRIAIYAAHTNLDRIPQGVSGRMADKLELQRRTVLEPMPEALLKLVVYVPVNYANAVHAALSESGAGKIGLYEACSFQSDGTGTFTAKPQANPFVGEKGELHREPETRLEMIVPAYLKRSMTEVLQRVHPYEEPAYDWIALQNEWKEMGFGIVGELPEAVSEQEFLNLLKTRFGLTAFRHSAPLGRPIRKVALCGGSGKSLLPRAMALCANAYVSADFKYHDWFEIENRLLVADIGHYESEQFTNELFFELLTKKMSNFAVCLSNVNTNPIKYF